MKTTDPVQIAAKLLDLSRRRSALSPKGTVPVSREQPGLGTVIVDYDLRTKTYDVGTAASSHATGRRAAVLPALLALLKREVAPAAALAS